MQVHALKWAIRNSIDPAAMAGRTEGALSPLMQSDGEQRKLRHESCLPEASRAEICIAYFPYLLSTRSSPSETEGVAEPPHTRAEVQDTPSLRALPLQRLGRGTEGTIPLCS